MAWQEASPLLNIKAPVQEAMNAVKEEPASAKSYNTTLMEMYNDLKARWNVIWQEPEMTDVWRRVEARKEKFSHPYFLPYF